MTALNLIVKIALFGVFISLLYLVIDYFLNIVVDNLDIPFLDLFYYLGVVQAIQVLISFSVVSYLANQVIAYFRSA